MDRKSFFKLLAGGVISGTAVLDVLADTSSYLKWKRINLKIGLPKPISVVHVSDSHLCFCDSRDNSKKQEVAKKRHLAYSGVPQTTLENDRMLGFLAASVAYAKKNRAFYFHTGDLIDFGSQMNFEVSKKYLPSKNRLLAMGNHEYSEYVWDKRTGLYPDKKNIKELEELARHDIVFASMIYGGVNFISIDNNYYNFPKIALERIKQEEKKGYPIILGFHIPIYTQKIFNAVMKKNNNVRAALVAVPDDKLALFPQEGARLIQKPTADTLEFMDYLAGKNSVRAILCGHLHLEIDDLLFGKIPQYCSGLGAIGYATELTIS